MAKFPFVGGAYMARSRNFDSQICINLFPVMNESGTAKAVAALYGTPGLRLWTSFDVTGTIRGMFRFSADICLIVCDNNVYSADTNGITTLIGNIAAGSTPVSMASNGTSVMLVTGTVVGYVIDPILSTVSQITDPDFVGANSVVFVDGYFVLNKLNSSQYQITSLYGTDFNALDFASAEGAPDKLITLLDNHREVWLFGEYSTEVVINTGNPDFPFERIQGAFLEQGCAAPSSVAKLDSSIFWLSYNNEGRGMVVRSAGYDWQRVSTDAIDYAIAQIDDISDAVAYAYQQEGHTFYQITFPSGQQTWVYDVSTNLWHQRAWRDPADAVLKQHRSFCHVLFAGLNLVGDNSNGRVYVLDLDYYTDNGDTLPRIRACAHLSSDEKMQFFHSMQIVMQTGVGLVSGQGSNPQAMLQWSDDGGHTWSNEHWASMGAIGEYKTRVRWRRLGRSRDRVFKVTITDPVKVTIIGATAEVTVGVS